MKRFFENTKTYGLKVAALLALAPVAEQAASAQGINSETGLTGAFSQARNTLSSAASSFIDVMLLIVGIVAIIVMVWAFMKKRKGDANANDAIADGALYTFLVVGFIYFVKAWFFR